MHPQPYQPLPHAEAGASSMAISFCCIGADESISSIYDAKVIARTNSSTHKLQDINSLARGIIPGQITISSHCAVECSNNITFRYMLV